MVRTETKKVIEYVCEKCGNTYSNINIAEECEDYAVFPFQFDIGMHVVFNGYEQRYYQQPGQFVEKTGIIKDRRINGIERRQWGHHCNLYEIKIDDSMMSQDIPEQDIKGILLDTKPIEVA